MSFGYSSSPLITTKYKLESISDLVNEIVRFATSKAEIPDYQLNQIHSLAPVVANNTTAQPQDAGDTAQQQPQNADDNQNQLPTSNHLDLFFFDTNPSQQPILVTVELSTNEDNVITLRATRIEGDTLVYQSIWAQFYATFQDNPRQLWSFSSSFSAPLGGDSQENNTMNNIHHIGADARRDPPAAVVQPRLLTTPELTAAHIASASITLLATVDNYHDQTLNPNLQVMRPLDRKPSIEELCAPRRPQPLPLRQFRSTLSDCLVKLIYHFELDRVRDTRPTLVQLVEFIPLLAKEELQKTYLGSVLTDFGLSVAYLGVKLLKIIVPRTTDRPQQFNQSILKLGNDFHPQNYMLGMYSSFDLIYLKLINEMLVTTFPEVAQQRAQQVAQALVQDAQDRE